MIIAGSKIYEYCGVCGELVRINKFILGSIHICLSEEEIKQKRFNNLNRQQPPMPEWMKKLLGPQQ